MMVGCQICPQSMLTYIIQMIDTSVVLNSFNLNRPNHLDLMTQLQFHLVVFLLFV